MVKQAFENTLRGKRAAMSGTLPLSTRSSHPRAGIRLGAGLVWPELEPQKVLRKRDQRPGGTAAPSRPRQAPGRGERAARIGSHITMRFDSRWRKKHNLVKKEDFRPNSSPLCGGLHTARACRRPARCAQPLRGDPLEREASFAHLYLIQSFLRVSAAACKNNTVG